MHKNTVFSTYVLKSNLNEFVFKFRLTERSLSQNWTNSKWKTLSVDVAVVVVVEDRDDVVDVVPGEDEDDVVVEDRDDVGDVGGVADRDDVGDVVPGEGEEENLVADLEAGLEEDEGIEVGGGEDVGIHDAGVAALVIGEEEGIQEAGDVVQGDEGKGDVMERENVEDELSMTLTDLCAANASSWIECRAMLSAVDGNRSILKDRCAAAVGCNRSEDPQINAVEHNASTPRVGNAAMVAQYRLIRLAD